MKTVMMSLNQVIDGRVVEEYRIGYHKVTVTYPDGADVRVEYVGDVTTIGERPVLSEHDIEDGYFWELPIAPHLLEPKEAKEIG
ncbi:hypothetical protein AB0K16_22300 [Nonomuraea jabiensis]|uniref:hypothetical protein n=1 Tax=Nonomuraea jabiensis TaxID=882448 RepID=UPI0034206753